jgi:transaldolase
VSSPFLTKITEAGVSIWLDDLSRERFETESTGSLQHLIRNRNIVGVTTNPAIFSQGITRSNLYNADLARYAKEGISAAEAIRRLTLSDVRRAAELFHSIHSDSDGVDGRISIEVDPELARASEATIAEGAELWQELNLPNILIKVPATIEGLVAIEELTRMGISVNVTLIFTAKRYDQVMDAYFNGLERRLAAGESIADIHSVASFFISRIDTEIDARLQSAVAPDLYPLLRGRAGIANALLAYERFATRIDSERWRKLVGHGARMQRPLWASTGVKDSAYPATLYVESLITAHSVNTMPEATLEAAAKLPSSLVIENVTAHSPRIDEAKSHLSTLMELGIDIDLVGGQLEEEGLEKFVTPWRSLHQKIDERLGS